GPARRHLVTWTRLAGPCAQGPASFDPVRTRAAAWVPEETSMDADKVRCLVSRGGTMVGMFNLDMISFAGGYYIVFEWEDMPDGNRRPLYMSPIDERFLQVL